MSIGCSDKKGVEVKCTDLFTDLPEYLKDEGLPWMQWVQYKGEECVACVNYQKSINARRPIIDISYCMTKALNNTIEKSVNFAPENFKPSKL